MKLVKVDKLEGKELDAAFARAQGFAVYRRHDFMRKRAAYLDLTQPREDRAENLKWLLSVCDDEYITADISTGRTSYVLFYSTVWAALACKVLSEARVSRTIDHSGLWIAYIANINDEPTFMQCDRNELVAGMRCLVASKLGNEIELPEDL